MTIKIIDFQSFKEIVNKLDNMTDKDYSKINIDFKTRNKDIAKRIKTFFDIADGKPEWNV